MDSISLVLYIKSSKNQVKLQKVAFILAGIIFLMNVLGYPFEENGNVSFFKLMYFLVYLVGGAANIAAAVFYEKLRTDKVKDNITRWLNALNGVILLFDGWQRLTVGKTGLSISLFTAGLMYLFVSYKWTIIKRRKLFTLSEDYIRFRRPLFESRKIPLSMLRTISLEGEQIDISLKNGKSYKLFLGENEEQVLNKFKQKLEEINKKLGR